MCDQLNRILKNFKRLPNFWFVTRDLFEYFRTQANYRCMNTCIFYHVCKLYVYVFYIETFQLSETTHYNVIKANIDINTYAILVVRHPLTWYILRCTSSTKSSDIPDSDMVRVLMHLYKPLANLWPFNFPNNNNRVCAPLTRTPPSVCTSTIQKQHHNFAIRELCVWKLT